MGVATFRRMAARKTAARGESIAAPPVPDVEVDQERHICPICGFVAKTRLTLGSHMRVHKKDTSQ